MAGLRTLELLMLWSSVITCVGGRSLNYKIVNVVVSIKINKASEHEYQIANYDWIWRTDSD